jgi:hypothetical protein
VSDTLKGFAAGVVVAGAVAVAAYFLFQPESTDDDRPPIVVSEGSIQFGHGHRWKQREQNNKKKWKVDHSAGKTVTTYQVLAINLTDLKVCVVTAPKISIDYELTNGQTRTFVLSRQEIGSSGKWEPILDAPEDLDDTNKLGLSFGGAGGIKRVAPETGQACDFALGEDVLIYVNPR